MRLRWVTAPGLMVWWGAIIAPSHAQILSPGSPAVELRLVLGWSDDTNKRGDGPGLVPQIILLPDHITVARNGPPLEARNSARECTKRAGPDGKLTASGAQVFMDCRRREAQGFLSTPIHAVMLPVEAGPSKCNETKLSAGSYRICASLLQQTPDLLRMEYEEDTDYGGKLYAYRARFDLALHRLGPDPLGDITGCTVKILAAFSFNPRQPTKLSPFDQVKSELCYVVPPMPTDPATQDFLRLLREGAH
jgi:hypothetical protein